MTTVRQPSLGALLQNGAPSRNGVLPHASSRGGVAPVRTDNARLVQLGLLVGGAVMLPLGLIVIGIGWYGIAHTPYEYDQLVYLVSGGCLGLGITFVGGFLYFGGWLARVAADRKESDRHLADVLLILADAVAHATPPAPVTTKRVPTLAPDPYGADPPTRELGAILVTAGGSSTVHRADCALLEGRTDLRPAGAHAPGLTPCRLCSPLD
jgi:hypothetical protein